MPDYLFTTAFHHSLAMRAEICNKSAMGDFVKVGENLQRHKSGTIYLRAKVAGKVIQKSLETSDLRVAKIARDARLDALRRAAVAGRTGGSGKGSVRTLGDALDLAEARLREQPQLKDGTREFYREVCQRVRETLPVDVPGRGWTEPEARRWWKMISGRYEAQRANNLLLVMRRTGALLVEMGLRADDPTANLKRMPIVAKELVIPSRARVLEVVASIRGMAKANSVEAADFVEFLAFAGCRVGQARGLRWEDVDGEWITFRAGVSGTKGARVRRLPLSDHLRGLLERRREDFSQPTHGPVFFMQSPKLALRNACERLKIPHMRVHDLRHFFATHALERGVDVPTVAKWLGHKDGGVLVLRTYGHIRDEHSLVSVGKMNEAPAAVAAPLEPELGDGIEESAGGA